MEQVNVFDRYKIIKDRISELELKLEQLNREIPARHIRAQIEATKITLKGNTELLKYLHGEGNLVQ